MVRIVIPDDYTGIFSRSPHLERIRRLGELTIFDTPVPDEEEAIRRLQGAQIAIGNRDRTPLSRRVLEALPDLKLICLTGARFNNLDYKAVTELGIPVAPTPTLSSRAVAELTYGLMISLFRDIARGDAAIRRGEWPSMTGIEMHGKRLGIIGLGKIGGVVASIAPAFQLQVVAWGPTLTPERAAAAGATYLSLEELLKTSDIVTIHLQLSSLSRGLIGADKIALMKPTAILINTARAAITDEAALIAALQERRIAGAALDVFMREPLPADSPLLKLDNVVMTPHVGFTTDRVCEAFVVSTAENLENYLAGKTITLVNPEVWERRRRPG